MENDKITNSGAFKNDMIRIMGNLEKNFPKEYSNLCDSLDDNDFVEALKIVSVPLAGKRYDEDPGKEYTVDYGIFSLWLVKEYPEIKEEEEFKNLVPKLFLVRGTSATVALSNLNNESPYPKYFKLILDTLTLKYDDDYCGYNDQYSLCNVNCKEIICDENIINMIDVSDSVVTSIKGLSLKNNHLVFLSSFDGLKNKEALSVKKIDLGELQDLNTITLDAFTCFPNLEELILPKKITDDKIIGIILNKKYPKNLKLIKPTGMKLRVRSLKKDLIKGMLVNI